MAARKRATKKASVPAARALSERDELCTGCGASLIVCPSTVRRLVRCCGACSHWTKIDVTWADTKLALERQGRRLRRRRA